MRILHTADLHLGRQLHGFSLEEDHAVILEQILDALKTHQPDLFIIAGDVFDRPAPPASALRQFNGFIAQARAACDAGIVMCAGNHDSADRIEAMAILANPAHDLIRGSLLPQEPALVLQDTDGPIAVSALPFAYEHAARACFNDPEIASPEDVLRAQIAAARPQVPTGARWIVVAHGFVAGGESSDSEKALTRVGGVEYVSAKVFEGAHYVALGHLHRPQQAGASHLRYSGAPLAFGFDESNCNKSLSLVEMDASGTVDIALLPLTPKRRLCSVEGKLSDLESAPESDDFLRVVLTDSTPQIDPMKRLRTRFPNTCLLSYARDAKELRNSSDVAQRKSMLSDPAALIDEFLQDTRAEGTSAPEADLIAKALDALERPV